MGKTYRRGDGRFFVDGKPKSKMKPEKKKKVDFFCDFEDNIDDFGNERYKYRDIEK